MIFGTLEAQEDPRLLGGFIPPGNLESRTSPPGMKPNEIHSGGIQDPRLLRGLSQ